MKKKLVTTVFHLVILLTINNAKVQPIKDSNVKNDDIP